MDVEVSAGDAAADGNGHDAEGASADLAAADQTAAGALHHNVADDASDNGEEDDDGDDEEDDDDEEEEDSSEDERPVERKVLPQRISRGRRMTTLVGEAAEADEVFWGQAAFDEDETDEDISSSELESSSSDDTDSDFDAPEPEDDEEGGAGAGRGRGRGGAAAAAGPRRAAKGVEIVDDDGRGKGAGRGRGGRYMDPALRASTGVAGRKGLDIGALAAAHAAQVAAGAAVSGVGAADGAGAGAAASGPGRGRRRHGVEGDGTAAEAGTDGQHQDGGGGGSVAAYAASRLRKSTSDRVATAEAARQDLERQEKEKSDKEKSAASSAAAGAAGAAAAPAEPEKRLTQAEVLQEAAHTTIENLRQLDSLIKIETERQARDAEAMSRMSKGHAFPAGTPLLRFHSKRGVPTTITFTEVDSVPSCIDSSAQIAAAAASRAARIAAASVAAASGAGAGSKSSPSAAASNATLPGEYPKQRKCVITGKPARYQDPATGLPYHDLAAFKILRQRYGNSAAGSLHASSGGDAVMTTTDGGAGADAGTGKQSKAGSKRGPSIAPASSAGSALGDEMAVDLPDGSGFAYGGGSTILTAEAAASLPGASDAPGLPGLGDGGDDYLDEDDDLL